MITSVRIKNLRSLADTGWLQIKPITLLLGANSSGKSTFLRSFPLFTQSVNKALRGPISWFDDSLVDFGDYETAKNRYANEGDKIQFYYDIEAPFIPGYLRSGRDDMSRLLGNVRNLLVSFSLSNDSKGTYISSVSYKVKNVELSLSIADRSGKVNFAVNGMKVNVGDADVRWNANYEAVLAFIKVNGRNLSKYNMEERRLYTWVKHQRKVMNAGRMKAERVEKFRKLLSLIEQYKRKNQWE